MKPETIGRKMTMTLGILICAAVLVVAGCSQQSLQGAGRGAVTGAAVGAVGGMVSAMVFGGDVGEAAARGAVWGGSTGAAAGAISGAAADSNQKKAQQAQQAQELEKLRKQLGDDTFQGLTALVDCKHDIAQGYGRTAAQSDNPDYALAGLWVQVLAYADNRQEGQARALFPDLVAKDSKLTSESQAESDMQEAVQELKKIRQEYDLPPDCS